MAETVADPLDQRPLTLHYKGDRRAAEFGTNGLLGPNLFNEYFVVTGLEYDPELDRTTATLRIARAEEIEKANKP